MSHSKKKFFVIMFSCLIFFLSVYFNLFFVYSVNNDELSAIMSGGFSLSTVVKMAGNTVRGYYNELIKEKSELTTPARTGFFIEMYGLTQSIFDNDVLISKKPGQTVFKTKDGRLVIEKLNKVYDYSEQVKSLKSFSEWLDEKKIDFLLAQAPTKEIDAQQYPTGMSQDENANDSIVKCLSENKVPFIDFRDNTNLSTNKRDWHYITDHHWTTKTALLSSQYLVQELNRIYGYGLDESILNAENFDCEKYENIFLGSAGKKAGTAFGGRDDFEIYLPKTSEEMLFTFEYTRVSGGIAVKEGNFDEAFIYREKITKDYYDKNPYSAYLGGEYPIAKIVNHKADSDKRIVVIKDSYANAVVPYLAMTAKEIIMIDPRWYEGSMKEYIEEYKPDAVVLIYNPGAYLEDPFFDF